MFQFFFLTTWNALAMEAAACYVGECSDPKRDAPKAIVGEAVLGLVIYTMVPLAFLVVLDFKATGAGLGPLRQRSRGRQRQV